MYLDNNRKLRGPEKLSENATLAILNCINALLECVDKETMCPFLRDIQTPYEENQTSRFQQIPFLPDLKSTPAKQFLEGESADAYFVILLYHLNELIENSSHQITLSSVLCLESLLLTSGANHLLPILPSLLSSLAITLRSNALLSWREKALMTFLFAHSLHLVVAPVTPQQPDLSDLVADWLKRIHETPHSETPSNPLPLQRLPNESQAAFQGRRVTTELREKVPPLLTLVLQSVASETHLTLRLLIDQACFLLLRPALTAFPSSVLALLDALVVDVTDERAVLQSVSSELMRQAVSNTLEDPIQRSSLLGHLSECMAELPSVVRMKNELSAQHVVRCVLGYTQLLENHLTEVVCNKSLLEEAELSLYEQMKQTLEIRDITTVGLDSSTTLFHITYKYVNDRTSLLLLQWIRTVWRNVDISDELMLTLLNECSRGDREAAWLAQFIVKDHNQAEFIDTSLDAIRLAQRHIKPNTEILLLSVTRLAIQSDQLNQYLPSLLSLLFFFRSQTKYPGLILSALWDLSHALSFLSPIEMAQAHADYLLDSALFQLRLVDTLSPEVMSINLTLLTTLWTDLLKCNTTKLSSLLAHARDSIEELCMLVQHRYLDAVKPLFPLVCLLVRLCKEKEKKEIKNESVNVGIPAVIERYIREKLNRLPSIEPRSVEPEKVANETDSNESSENETERDEIHYNDMERIDETTPELTQLKTIISTIQYCLRSPGLLIPRTVLDILGEVTKLEPTTVINLLLPTLPLFSILLQNPQSHLYTDTVDLILRIASLDTRVTASRLLELWPLLREGLNGCLLAREGDFSVINSAAQGIEIETRLLHSLCEGYCDEIILSDCCGDVLSFIDERWILEELPSDARRFIVLAYRFNLDEVIMYLESRGEVCRHQHSVSWCRRFQSSVYNPSLQENKERGVVVRIIDECLN